jgi:DNA-directed RNA polymerase specialized sigma24 family protein
VTDEARAVLSADDAELLNRVCAGDTAAFQIVYQRHKQAARWLARDLVVTIDEVDGVVAETFEQLLQVTRRGSGPADAFRPYMLTALRRVCDRRREESQESTGDHLPDAAEPYLDLAVASLDDPLIVRAYLSLPERWMAVLWHTEIEGASQAEVGPVLGLTRNGVAALRRRAKEGLTQAYLQMYTSGVTEPECATVALRLGPFIRDAVSGPDSANVTQHLSQCDRCRSVFAELSDVSLPLRAMVAPAFLGGSAAYYLSRTAPAAKASTAPAPAPWTTAVGTTAMAGAAGAGAGAAWWLRPAAFLKDTARPRRWFAAGGAAVIVLGAIAFAVAAGEHRTPLTPAGTDQAQAPASLQAPTALDQPSATPARSTTAPGVVRASGSRSTRATQPASTPGSTSPAGLPAKSPAPHRSGSSSPVRLTAAVDVYGGHHDATVVFNVSDTGSARTRELIVSVALPAGSSLQTWPHGHGNGGGGGFGGGGNGGGGFGGGGNGGGGNGHHGDSGQWGQSGWSCKATSSGARCRHAAIPAGGQSQGVIFISINGSSACGQTVSVTATSRSASATAQSPEEIQC